MFKRRSVWTLVVVLGLLASIGADGCGGNPQIKSFPLQVVTKDLQPQLGVANATITIRRADDPNGSPVATQTTDAAGAATIVGNDNQALKPGNYTITVTAAGYKDFTTNLTVDANNAISLADGKKTIQLSLSAPALVFYTFTGSIQTPQHVLAAVQVPAAQPPFQGDTIDDPAGVSPYATVIVPNLKPSTSYSYTVGAFGFQSVNGPPPAATTSADNSFTKVFVLLSPATVNVEFHTSFRSATGTNQLVATQAIVTVGNSSVTTQPDRTGLPFYSGTLNLKANTTYQYSACFTQFGATMSGSFTTPVSGSSVFPIILDPSTASKCLP